MMIDSRLIASSIVSLTTGTGVELEGLISILSFEADLDKADLDAAAVADADNVADAAAAVVFTLADKRNLRFVSPSIEEVSM
eukprot:CAMPEP_0170840670 /NCGR_PEP_ID=MMETSP0734-20130129/4708_1 /TAXON_ID=186038 /ORGANISM="Fragilariopsis kerguelensis, Strain L26-C5" /LENGTH=81 /DNA_ID=CAMNT_0011208507 /DNA_START=158 /DNA_END=403 /DNA_ORIENTATION=+